MSTPIPAKFKIPEGTPWYYQRVRKLFELACILYRIHTSEEKNIFNGALNGLTRHHFGRVQEAGLVALAVSRVMLVRHARGKARVPGVFAIHRALQKASDLDQDISVPKREQHIFETLREEAFLNDPVVDIKEDLDKAASPGLLKFREKLKAMSL